MSEYTYHIPPPCDEPIDIVYVDDHILVVSKPAGLLSVPGRFVKDCALNRLVFDYPDARIVHRLDLDTSGLLILANSKLATSDLNRQFRERQVDKTYDAIVAGLVEQEKGEIDLPIARDPDNRPKQKIDAEHGKASLTRYEVVARDLSESRISLFPVTGRSHQLRIHLASIGHPILGCDLYADPAAFEAAPRLMLHASKLTVSHPKTGERMDFESPVPF
jgi:tRNA pseudouridine32 synthase/23S rRNA pseudouridine746 synthase